VKVKLLTTLIVVVLSYLSMSFLSRLFKPFSTMTSPATPVIVPAGAQTATVAAGCFWGVEHMYRRTFANKGLYDARVGYIGGDSKNPSYRAVCSGRSGRKHPFGEMYLHVLTLHRCGSSSSDI
jgi:peptide-methionine (S)-S-oxide reductase